MSYHLVDHPQKAFLPELKSPFFWLLFGIFLIARPYDGIWHDGILYAGQALRLLDPTIFNHDLFFAYGSQDDFSLFSNFYAVVIRTIGLDHTAFYLTMVGRIAWFFAFVWFAAGLFNGPALWIGITLVVGFSPYYDGGFNIFSYAEPFVTARIFSEIAALFALGWLLRARVIKATLGLITAALLHPLIAAPAWGLAIFVHWKKRWFGLVLFVTLLLLSILYLWPELAQRIFLQLDGDWLNTSLLRSEYLFARKWPIEIWGKYFFLCAVLWWGWRIQSNPIVSRWAGSVLLLAGIGLGLALLGDVTQLALLLQLQTWRVMWLAQLIALLTLGALLLAGWQKRGVDAWLAMVMGSAVFATNGFSMGAIAATGLLGWYLTVHFKVVVRRQIAWVFVLIPIQMIAWFLLDSPSRLSIAAFLEVRPEWTFIMSESWLIMGLFLVLALLIKRFTTVSLPTLILGSGALMIATGLGVSIWGLQRILYYNDPETQQSVIELQNRIPPSATMYWPNNVTATWFWLRRANYISYNQTAGIILSPETTRIAFKRVRRVCEAGFFNDGMGVTKPLNDSNESQNPSVAKVGFLCGDTDLDYIILENSLEGLAEALVGTIKRRTKDAYFAYSCKIIRDTQTISAPLKTYTCL